MNDQPQRKPNRLKEYDYSQNGAYFITFCTDRKQKLLCRIVGDGVLDVPQVQLTAVGKIVNEQMQSINELYENIRINKYVIMPNHVHFIVFVRKMDDDAACTGMLKIPSPANAVVPRLVSTIKRLTNRKIGHNIWQRSYYDHVIRDENDYLEKWKYIDDNPAKWHQDGYYVEE